ncbi:hypothetical protein [Jannaschia sp. LMIT008]|uniref:hypothetical protein n=1 Tax=Jannaschia maritima TaxID=3032585 RepID=UPI002811D1E1|nr:hypothetical protein [Jannaschia sp. LMIT008]
MSDGKKRGFLSLAHPMFRPLWSRVLATVLVAGWTVMEVLNGAVFWAILFGAACAWMAWNFFVAFDPEEYR